MSSFSLLERASAELLNWLHETAQVQSIEKNTPLLREAEINQKVVLLLKGQLILTSTILKREVDVLGDLSIGDLVGEMSWLEQQPAFATTTAKTGAMVLEIPFKSLDSLQNSNPAIAAELNRLLAQKLALQIQEQNIWVHRLKENTLPEAPFGMFSYSLPASMNKTFSVLLNWDKGRNFNQVTASLSKGTMWMPCISL